ncbi:MAG: transcription antitermination factor NusB [Thermodesulfobacteriota bacterium]
MGKRRRSREFALQVLYQLEINTQDINKILEHLRENVLSGSEDREFTERIVRGVREHLKEIDHLLEEFLENWRLDRLSSVDRNILRLALFELLYCKEIPPKVTINEAIDLGKRYGTEDSGAFINGVLDRIQNEVLRKPL